MAHAHIAIAVGERGAPGINSYKQTVTSIQAATGLQPRPRTCLVNEGAELGAERSHYT